MVFLGDGIVGEVSDAEIHQFGRQLDESLRGCASRMDTFLRDEVTLAYLTLAEGVFYLRGWRNLDHDALVAPVLDNVLPLYPATQDVDDFGIEAVKTVGPWLRASSDYHALTDAVIHALQGRMKCSITGRGRLVFYPISSFATEVRNRWFAQRMHILREALGRDGVLEDNAETRAIIRRIDAHVESQDPNLRETGACAIPTESWYTRHAEGIADRALRLQFLQVADTEVWAGLTKDQVIRAIRPLYVRAACRAFAHIRVFAYLRHRYSATGPVIRTIIEKVRLNDLVTESAAAAGIPLDRAEVFVRSMVRVGREERYGVLSYPLIPLCGDRVAFLPSAILFTGWPSIREKAATILKGGNESVSRARTRRHTQAIIEAAAAAGYGQLASEVPLVDPVTKKTLTDLDVVLVNSACDRVLVVQLKSFLTPSNLLDIDRAEEAVRNASDQCDRAAASLELVRATIEKRLNLRLADTWVLRQVIVVEANTGTGEPSQKYPAVSLEWLEAFLRKGRPTLDELWQAARDLPDAQTFFESIAPAFELFDDNLRDLKTTRSAAVFQYASEK